jgi:hypothetical protein
MEMITAEGEREEEKFHIHGTGSQSFHTTTCSLLVKICKHSCGHCIILMIKKSEAVPLHAMQPLRGRGSTAPTHS